MSRRLGEKHYSVMLDFTKNYPFLLGNKAERASKFPDDQKFQVWKELKQKLNELDSKVEKDVEQWKGVFRRWMFKVRSLSKDPTELTYLNENDRRLYELMEGSKTSDTRNEPMENASHAFRRCTNQEDHKVHLERSSLFVESESNYSAGNTDRSYSAASTSNADLGSHVQTEAMLTHQENHKLHLERSSIFIERESNYSAGNTDRSYSASSTYNADLGPNVQTEAMDQRGERERQPIYTISDDFFEPPSKSPRISSEGAKQSTPLANVSSTRAEGVGPLVDEIKKWRDLDERKIKVHKGMLEQQENIYSALSQIGSTLKRMLDEQEAVSKSLTIIAEKLPPR